MKVAIIAIAKNENLYVNEWVNYHLHMGFDNIIICDNDDTLVLKDVIEDKSVIIEDWAKVTGVQQIAYRETFRKYKSQFDWILFIDIDEYLVLENHINVKNFLSSYESDVQCINLNYKHFTDNEELDVINNDYSIFDRFKTEAPNPMDALVKSFISTNIPENMINRITQHSIRFGNIKSINVLGERHDGRFSRTLVQKIAWINHYPTKTIGEYVRQKYFRGGPNNNNAKYATINYFFRYNTKTPEKKEYAEKLIKEIKNKMQLQKP